MLTEIEQLVLLAVLRLEPDAYGAQIDNELAARGGRVSRRGVVYMTLGRLEKKGHLTSRMGAPRPQVGGRSRRLYAITPVGYRALWFRVNAFRRMIDGLEFPRIAPPVALSTLSSSETPPRSAPGALARGAAAREQSRMECSARA